MIIVFISIWYWYYYSTRKSCFISAFSGI